MNKLRLLIVAGVVAGLSACATDDPNKRAKTGAAIGAEDTAEGAGRELRCTVPLETRGAGAIGADA